MRGMSLFFVDSQISNVNFEAEVGVVDINLFIHRTHLNFWWECGYPSLSTPKNIFFSRAPCLSTFRENFDTEYRTRANPPSLGGGGVIFDLWTL